MKSKILNKVTITKMQNVIFLVKFTLLFRLKIKISIISINSHLRIQCFRHKYNEETFLNM